MCSVRTDCEEDEGIEVEVEQMSDLISLRGGEGIGGGNGGWE